MSKRVVFYNTYEPVVALFRDLPPELISETVGVDIVVSRSQYRHRDITLKSFFDDTPIRVREVGLNLGSPLTSRGKKTVAMISYMFTAAFDIFFRKADLRIFLTQPPFFASLALLKKIITKERYACVLMDLYPEVLEANGLLKLGGVPSKILRSLALKVHRGASKLIVIGKDMSDYVESTGVPPGSIVYIPNWASNEGDHPISHDDNSLRAQLGFDNGDFIVLYSGNMGVSHLFDDILLAAKKLESKKALKFVFIGAGPRLHEVQAFKKSHKLDNIFLFDYQPVERLVESLSIGDVHFVSLRDGFGGMVVPSKIFGALSAGRPILFQGSGDSEVAHLLEDNSCGSQVDPNDVPALVKEIELYLTDTERRSIKSDNAFQAYQARYSSKVGISKYKQVIQSILD